MATTVCVKNNSKAVKVLKAVGLPPLRLFPGCNSVDKASLDKYFKNPAALGIRDEYLSIVQSPTQTDLEQAEKAKAKNDELNKAKKVIQQQTAKLEKGAADAKALQEKLKEKDKELAALNKRIEALEKTNG